MKHQFTRRASLLFAGLLFGWPTGRYAATAGEPWADAVLRRQGVAADDASLLDYLKRLQPAGDAAPRVARLIEQLGSDAFEEREAATRELARIGGPARKQLERATAHEDVEVARRAAAVLKAIAGGDGDGRFVLAAVLDTLKRRRVRGAARPLLQAIPLCDDDALRDMAQEALWACAGPKDAGDLTAGLEASDPRVRCASVVGLEAVQGPAALHALRHFLSDPSEQVRLAAARALVNQRPRDCLQVLVGLSRSADDATRLRSHYLLRQLTGQEVDFVEVALGNPADRWAAWLRDKGPAAELRVPLDGRRWRLRGPEVGFVQTFAREGPVGREYGDLRYSATVEAKPWVKRGQLHLPGNHPQGDQRLAVDALSAFGAPTFPARFTVRARLGGRPVSPGAWHVGVSVGNARLLFHPAFAGGAFRAERVDRLQPLLENQDMGFTPAGDVLHEMVIEVQQQADGVRFGVTVTAGGRRFRKVFVGRPEDVGEVNRVGLERSGREGGDALFGPLLID